MTRRAAVLLVVVLAAPVAAQNTYKPGRTADGHPDLTGIWDMRGAANWNVEGHTGGPGVPASRSVIVDPPDGQIAYHPAALVQGNARNPAVDRQANRFRSELARSDYGTGPLPSL